MLPWPSMHFNRNTNKTVSSRDIVVFLYFYCCVPTYSMKLLLYVIYSANSRLTYWLTYLLTYTQRHNKRQSVRAAYKHVSFWSVVLTKWWPLFYDANCNISLIIIYPVGGGAEDSCHRLNLCGGLSVWNGDSRGSDCWNWIIWEHGGCTSLSSFGYSTDTW